MLILLEQGLPLLSTAPPNRRSITTIGSKHPNFSALVLPSEPISQVANAYTKFSRPIITILTFSYVIFGTKPSNADVSFERDILRSKVSIFGTISRADADQIVLQQLKTYLQEMDVTDVVYQEMVNTEPSDMKLYGDKQTGLRDVYRIIPNLDPTYDEIEKSYNARWHGISTMEMRKRESNRSRCYDRKTEGIFDCQMATEWGLSSQVYADRTSESDLKCKISDEDRKTLDLVIRKERRDHPIMLKREACVQNIMLGR